mmetsp:Transcript_39478/g.125279  ORF Transcript_39478/g.125279 Transcript_39478/m.125279 type:complete len:85 (-) Transcript_39478:220-474(-)
MKYAAEELLYNYEARREILEAAASPLGAACSRAPIFTVPDFVFQESGTLVVVAHNLAGDSKTEVFAAQATFADLARRLVEWHGR